MASFRFVKSKLVAPLLASVLLFTQQCHAGYAIADDCNPEQKAFITNAFTSAAALAIYGQSNTNEGFSADGTQVFQWLFGTEGVGGIRSSVQLSLAGVEQNTQPVANPQGGTPLTADVKVYCTHDRLKQGPERAGGERRWFDPAIGQFLKLGNKWDCTHALAWTIVPNLEKEADKPDTLQICPWFLDYAMKQNTQFLTQLKPGVIGTMIKKLKMDKFATWAKYTPIDLFQLFDKVIVHELTHTRRGGQKDDVDGFSGYGWKNARKLSTVREARKGPGNNADSIALFASVSGLIRERGGMVNEDGTFREGPAPAASKRSYQFDASQLKARPLF